MSSFDSTKIRLFEVLKEIKDGKIQLPDFQRGWIWDDNRIKALLASVAKSFPIGVIMLLETGNPDVKFKTKCIEGVNLETKTIPKHLVLDGQQRLTSLFLAIASNNVVNTKTATGYAIQRWYYIDMKKTMEDNDELEESIVSINEKKQTTSDIGRTITMDLSGKNLEFENLMFPICMLDEPFEWSTQFQEFWNYDKEKIKFFNEFYNKIIARFNEYEVPIIILSNSNSKEAVCQVFEKVNTGGVSLTVFELLTATFASDDFDLKQDWESIQKKFKNFKTLNGVKNTDLIQAITLLSSYTKKTELTKLNTPKDLLPAISCKRKDMLDLSLEEYIRNRDRIVDGYIKACKILSEYHIYSDADLPYTTQLIPMSAILAVLGNEIDNTNNKSKLMKWFWCGVFGELYGGANETRFALDLPQVVDFIINNGPEPITIFDANFSPSRLLTLRTRNSAAYKGIYSLLLEDGTRDWLSSSTIDNLNYFSESIDIHHIFPVVWCEKNNIHQDQYNSIINKTPLSGRTNRVVSGDAPSAYLKRLQLKSGVSEDEFMKILNTHALNIDLLLSDDFEAFFYDRKERILSKIEKAIGKRINRDSTNTPEGLFIEDDNDE